MSDRRTILRGLATLPLIGGSVALIGSPTAVAVPVTPEMMGTYCDWLSWEWLRTTRELSGGIADGSNLRRNFEIQGTAFDWHYPCGGGGPDGPQPSTRAAIVLSAVGCPLSCEEGR